MPIVQHERHIRRGGDPRSDAPYQIVDAGRRDPTETQLLVANCADRRNCASDRISRVDELDRLTRTVENSGSTRLHGIQQNTGPEAPEILAGNKGRGGFIGEGVGILRREARRRRATRLSSAKIRITDAIAQFCTAQTIETMGEVGRSTKA